MNKMAAVVVAREVFSDEGSCIISLVQPGTGPIYQGLGLSNCLQHNTQVIQSTKFIMHGVFPWNMNCIFSSTRLIRLRILTTFSILDKLISFLHRITGNGNHIYHENSNISTSTVSWHCSLQRV